MLRDKHGKLSSMRVVMLVTGLFFFLQWGIGLWMDGTFAPSLELTSFVTTALLTKVVQKKFE